MSRALAVAALIGACASPAPVGPAPARPVPAVPQRFSDAAWRYSFADSARAQKLAAAFPALDRALAAEVARQRILGAVVGVVIDGELAYAKGFGKVGPASDRVPDADTVYRIGSISKSFSALAILGLRDAGVLAIDDPLTRWIPEAAGLVYPTRDSPVITLRRLLEHTSGLPRDTRFDQARDERTFLALLDGMPLDRAPSEQWSYSNLGFALLGIVAARAAGVATFDELLAQRIATPLGMTATTTDAARVPADRLAPAIGPDGATLPVLESLGVAAGAGGIFSSVRDLARYVAFQLDAYPPRDAPERPGLARRGSIREAHASGVLVRAELQPPARLVAGTYGFGWQRKVTCNADDVVEHGGTIDSYRAQVQMLTTRGVGVIVLSNAANAAPGELADIAFETLGATGALIPRARTATAAPAFVRAMGTFLAVYNQWDAARLAGILARPVNPLEQGELAGYLALHGACTAIRPVQVTGPLAATFALTCARGSLEIAATAAPDGKLLGFVGSSRGIPVPPEVATAGAAVLSLIGSWDEALFQRTFADPATAQAWFRPGRDALAAGATSCKVKAFVHEGFDWYVEASCARGPEQRIDLQLDHGKVRGVRVRPLVRPGADAPRC